MLYDLWQKVKNIPYLKQKVVLVVFLLLVLWGLFWFINHGVLEISATGVKPGDVSYTITDQKSLKSSFSTHQGSKLTRLTPKGDYEVLVQEGNSSYFSIVHVGGFLRKTTKHGIVKKESARTFVGNNPSSCMYFINSVLLSYECAGTFSNLQVHLPATSNAPSYGSPSPSPIEDDLEGIAHTKQGSLVLLHATQADEDAGAIHTVFILNDDASLIQPKDLTNLSTEKKYSIKSFRDGFLVYDSDFIDVLYYTSIEAQPVKISLSQVTDKGYGPYLNSAKNDSFAVAYTNLEYEPHDGQPEKQNPKAQTKININKAGNSRQLTFNKQFGSMSLCGNDKLCLQTKDQLEVYDISGKKQVLMYRVGNVSAIQDSTKGLLISRDKQILQLDVDHAEGLSNYSYGDYKYCGINVDDSGYNLCVINNRGLKVALRIDQNQDDSDSIDQKINALFNTPEVDTLSVYGKYILVSPGTDNKPEQIKTINDQIQKAIDRVGIDRNKYIIYNPYQDVQPEDVKQLYTNPEE